MGTFLTRSSWIDAQFVLACYEIPHWFCGDVEDFIMSGLEGLS